MLGLGIGDIWFCFKQLLKHSSPVLRSKLEIAQAEFCFVAFLTTSWLLVSYIYGLSDVSKMPPAAMPLGMF